MNRLILLLCSIVLLAACAAPGKPPPPPREPALDDAKLVIYNVIRPGMGTRPAHFYLDKVRAVSLAPASHSVLSLPQGRYELMQRPDWDMDFGTKPLIVNVDLVPRQKRYLRMNYWHTGTTLHWELKEVSEQQARNEIGPDSKYEHAFAFGDRRPD